MKENKDQIIIPEISHKEVNRAWKKFLRRHGYKYDSNAMIIKPNKKGGKICLI